MPIIGPHLGAGGAPSAAATAACSSLLSPTSDVNMPETSMVSERRGVHPGNEGVQLCAGPTGDGQSSPGAFDAAPVVPASSEAAPRTGPEDAARVAALLECARGMLLGAGRRPSVPADCPTESQSTNGLLLDARCAINTLWAAQQDDIRVACAPQPIDEMDCYGQLLAVAVRGSLLETGDAGDVGRRAHVQQGRAVSTQLRIIFPLSACQVSELQPCSVLRSSAAHEQACHHQQKPCYRFPLSAQPREPPRRMPTHQPPRLLTDSCGARVLKMRKPVRAEQVAPPALACGC